MEDINNTLSELTKFSPEVLSLNSPVESGLVAAFEKKFQVKLPNDYIYLLSETNGFNLMGDEVLGITFHSDNEDLVNVYQFEHFEVMYPQYKNVVPFCADGGGNFYCFDTLHRTKEGNSCNIIFWVSNYEYSELDPPEVTHECLSDFINECIISWTLEKFDYDGEVE